MSIDLIKRDKCKWLSSRLNIAVIPSFSQPEDIVEKYDWVSSRLKINSKPILAENPPEYNRQRTKTEEISKVKDFQIPISTKLSISRSHCQNNIKTYSAESTHISSQMQKADDVITTDIEEGDNKCDQCPFIAKTNNGLKMHVAKIHKRPSYCKICNELLPKYHKHCKFCSFVAEQKGKLGEHAKLAHQTNTPPQCNICHKIFKSKVGLWAHTHIHLGIKYKCDKCQRSFRRKSELDWHNFRNLHSKTKTECTKCGKSFPSTVGLNQANNLSLHMKLAHKPEHPVYKCKLCSAVIYSKQTQQGHIQKHKENYKIHHCSQCDFKILSKTLLSHHCIKLHNRKKNLEPSRKCLVCRLRVKTNMYKEHKSTHFESCKKCDYRGVSVVKHMEKKHERACCTTCGIDCKNLLLLSYHQQNMHRIYDERIYVHKCDKCKVRSRTLKLLKRHQIKYHRSIQCGTCEFEADNVKTMRSHRLKHEIKYITCALCDFRSTFEKAFNIHRLRVHEGYSCEKCKHVFTNASNLNIHISDHTNLECKECKFVAPTRTDFKNHSKSTHEGMKCKMCDHRFKVFKSLYRHELKHKELECKLCNVVVKFEKDFPTHLRNIHKQCKCKNKDSPTHVHRHDLKKCGKCDFEGTKPNMKVHEKKHKKVKSLRKRFKSKKHKAHTADPINLPIMFLKNKESEINSKTTLGEKATDLFEFRCDICEFKTSQPNSLLQHVIFHNMNFETENASVDT